MTSMPNKPTARRKLKDLDPDMVALAKRTAEQWLADQKKGGRQ